MRVKKTGPDERSTYCHHVSWLHYCFWTRFPTVLKTETQVSPTITKKLIETIVWISSRKNPSHTSRFLTQFSRTGSTDPTSNKRDKELQHLQRGKSPFGDAYEAPRPISLDAAEVTASDRQANTGVLDRTTRTQILTPTRTFMTDIIVR